jgi:tetratricopeptide (TPR) repeat protein
MKLLILALLVTTVTSVFGQPKLTAAEKTNYTRHLNKGIESFNAGRTNEAIESFKRAEALDAEAWKLNYWMAACHYELTSFNTAQSYIDNAIRNLSENEEADAEFYELVGKINHRLGNVETAITAYKKTAILMGNKMALSYGITANIEQCERMISAKKQGFTPLRKPLAIQLNSLEDEYAPILLKGGEVLFFTARRPETTGENLNPDDSKYFEDMYRANWNPITMDYEMDYEFFKSINTNGFDALSFVNKDGTYALLTINTAYTEKTTKSSDLFELYSDEPFDWSNPTILKGKGVNTDYFEGSATLAEQGENGAYMVFTSDRRADVSGLDLFGTIKSDLGFGPVTPLPKEINSEGNETTPFITSDGKFLFFSSDELPGFGGYDIFYSMFENGTWSAPVNLGPEINSVNDDTHFNIDLSAKKASFASMAEKDGYYSYDLFQADLSTATYPFIVK